MSEKSTREEMEREAQYRLEILTKKGLHENVLREFKENGHDGENGLYYSEATVMRFCTPGSKKEVRIPAGILYWLDNKGEAEQLKAIVQKVEEKFGVMAYMAIYGHYVYGGVENFEMLDVFVVSPYKEEWWMERANLNEGVAFCWTENITDPMLSEFGCIQFKVAGGGLIRDCN